MIEPAVAAAVEDERPAPAAGARRRRRILVGVVALAVLAVDQATKAWALAALDDRTVELVGSLRLRLVFNTGSAFSIGEGLGPVLAVAGVVIVVVLLRASRDVQGAAALVSLGLVLGGAVGNLVDRALRAGDGFLGGAVVDFVDLGWWPVFNVADVAICVGVGLVALTLGREPATDPGAG